MPFFFFSSLISVLSSHFRVFVLLLPANGSSLYENVHLEAAGPDPLGQLYSFKAQSVKFPYVCNCYWIPQLLFFLWGGEEGVKQIKLLIPPPCSLGMFNLGVTSGI